MSFDVMSPFGIFFKIIEFNQGIVMSPFSIFLSFALKPQFQFKMEKCNTFKNINLPIEMSFKRILGLGPTHNISH